MSGTSPSKPPRDPLPWVFWGVFIVGLLAGLLWITVKPSLQESIPVLSSDLPAYHVITDGDVITKALEANLVMTDVVRDGQSLIGRYTRNALSADNPIREGDVVSVTTPALITDTLAAAVSANSATILGGQLRPGDVVILAAVPISDTTATPAMIFDAVLVLDVKVEANDTIVVLAIPAGRWMDYLTKTRNATVMLARRVE